MNREYIRTELAPMLAEHQVSIARIAEEASELTKEAMKALRFGLQNSHPAGGPTNAQKMVEEFRDIEAALLDLGLL